MNHLPILIIIVPLAVAFIVLLFKKYMIVFSLVSTIFSFLSLLMLFPPIMLGKTIIYHLGGWPGPLGISIRIDGLSHFFAAIVFFIGIMVILYSIPDKKYNQSYYFLLLMLISSMVAVIFTDDLFNMYVLYDLVTISTYLLIAYHQEGIALRASFNYLLMSGAGLSLFLLGVGSLYALTGTLQISSLSEQIPLIFISDSKIVLMSVVVIVTCMGIKMALVPLHGWLPDAHSLAPSPVSAILSGVVIKVGVYCLIRIIFNLFGKEEFLVNRVNQHSLLILGAITLLFGAIMALTQTDLKRILAYSTINQVGIIVIGFSFSNITGLQGALFHVLNHALLKGALFFCAGIIIFQTGTKKIKELRGFGKKNSLIAFCFVILSLGIIGIPPMNGFISKFLICSAAIEAGHSELAVLIVATSLITAAYYFRVIQIFYSEPDPLNKETIDKKIAEKNNGWGYFTQLWPILILTVLSLFLGIIPSLGISLFKPAINVLLTGISL